MVGGVLCRVGQGRKGRQGQDGGGGGGGGTHAARLWLDVGIKGRSGLTRYAVSAAAAAPTRYCRCRSGNSAVGYNQS